MPKDKEPIKFNPKRRKRLRRRPTKPEEPPRIPPDMMEKLTGILQEEIDKVGGQDSFTWRRFQQVLRGQLEKDSSE